MTVRVIHGDMLDVLPTLSGLDACVCDPPYHLTNNTGTRSPYPGQYTPIGRPKEPKGGFMGKQWDGGDIAFRPETWRLVLDALKPGAYLLACGGTRTSHRMTCAIEDAGFEIRDTLCWLYGSGFPKSLDVSKAIDKAAGATREIVGVREYAGGHVQRSSADKLAPPIGTFVRTQDDRLETIPATPEAAAWAGWGTALKPAHEPIILARKPLQGTVAANVLRHGTGAINVDACRVGIDEGERDVIDNRSGVGFGTGNTVGGNQGRAEGVFKSHSAGRWPANVLHDGSAEVEAVFAAFGERTSGVERGERGTGGIWSPSSGVPCGPQYGDTGSASRFFYCAKADAGDRADSRHPTVKPVALMRWLVRLVTPPGGTVLDPFAGSGTTGEAAMLEGFNALLVEQDAQHAADIRHRIARWSGADLPLLRATA